jgi:hypothetical protein
MKLTQLKSIVKEAVKEAIQEEMKDILLEAVRSPKQVVADYQSPNPSLGKSLSNNPIPQKSKEELRESYRNILGETAAAFTTNGQNQPLRVNGTVDTTSPNGSLPQGNVSMDQIMGLMTGKV